jgi:diketogulonate reductase-like aldo/keto reductase
MTDDPTGTTIGIGNGVRMPLLGIGVWLVPDGPECEDVVTWALEAGYRHVDTAQAYGNEASVGRALAASDVPRSEVFVTTKFLPTENDPVAEAEASLERLGIDQLDLYLVHWPAGGPTRAWARMEAALEQGLTRAIGISNFDPAQLAAVLASGSTPPAVNQIQLNPFAYRRALVEANERAGVVLEAYSPLTHGRAIDDERIAAIAADVGRTPAQVMLRWAVQHGFAVLPKSARRERVVENAAIFDFTLDDDAMGVLDALDETGGTERATETPWW